MDRTIRFWREREQYGAFSNFHPCKFIWRDVEFNCSEQAFMWAKAKFFQDEETAEKIMQETDPRKIKKLGRLVKNFDEKSWDYVKYRVMLNINYEKYSQNKDLRDLLISTGNARIEEDSPFDYIWGTGKNGSGKNLLGCVLMEVRNLLSK